MCSLSLYSNYMYDSKEVGEGWELAICVLCFTLLLDNGDGEGGTSPLVAKILYVLTGPIRIAKILHWLMSLNFPIVFTID